MQMLRTILSSTVQKCVVLPITCARAVWGRVCVSMRRGTKQIVSSEILCSPLHYVRPSYSERIGSFRFQPTARHRTHSRPLPITLSTIQGTPTHRLVSDSSLSGVVEPFKYAEQIWRSEGVGCVGSDAAACAAAGCGLHSLEWSIALMAQWWAWLESDN